MRPWNDVFGGWQVRMSIFLGKGLIMKNSKHKTTAVIIILMAGFILPAGVASGGAQEDAIAGIKADFDAAMGLSLEDRTIALELLEQDIDNLLFESPNDSKARVDLLSYKYKTQRELAKYPDSRVTFGQYIAAIRNVFSDVQAQSIIEAVINKHFNRDSLSECVELIDQGSAQYINDADITPFLLLRKAQCLYQLNGRYNDALAPAQKLIKQYPDSKWRPTGLRLLANLYVHSGQTQESLNTLTLMEQQYQETWHAHYAHMRPATIMEVRGGNVEGAINKYQQSLQKYTNHCFSLYINGEVDRLRKVLEEQLIDMALEGLAANNSLCDRPSNSMVIRYEPIQIATAHFDINILGNWCLTSQQIAD